MRGCRLFILGMLLALLAVPGISSLYAQANPAAFNEQPGPGFQTAISNTDFDGDSKPDLAIGSSRGLAYVIEIQFTAQCTKTYLTLANGGVGTRIFAYDVDRDSYPDLIVTSAASLLPIAVYLGDGKGHFQEAKSWVFLPPLFDTPYRYEPDKHDTSLVSLAPQTRFTFDRALRDINAPNIEAGGWVRFDFEKPLVHRSAADSNPRSPPVFPLV